MKWTWDPAAGAIYLYVRPAISEVVTVDLSEGDPTANILLDIDTGTGQLAGIEILIPDGGSTFVKLKALLKDEPEILGGCPSAYCPHLERAEGCDGSMGG